MPAWSQNNKSIGIETSLDDNPPVEGDEGYDGYIAYDFVLLDIEGGGAISELFSYKLTLASQKNDIDAANVIGQNVDVWVEDTEGNKHYINGYMNRFAGGTKVQHIEAGQQRIKTVTIGIEEVQVLETLEPTMVDSTYNKFIVEIVPALWFLKKSRNCRVFQNQTALTIIESIINSHNANCDHTRQIVMVSQLNGLGLPTLDYCVQYQESDFDFISRVAASNGLFYFFSHEADENDNYTHTVKFTNDTAYYGAETSSCEINSWDVEHEFINSQWALRDFDFKNAEVVSKGGDDQKDYDQFDYPGGLVFPGCESEEEEVDTTLFKDERLDHYIDRENASEMRVTGNTINRDFFAGRKFTRSDVSYVVARTHFKATETSYYNSIAAAPTYKNTFTAIPSSEKYYSTNCKPKPIMHGPQTAIVVGPEDESVYTDEYGRVRVQFHWDRYGVNDETSSCWLRVSQSWAGSGWGEMALPHVGHEVIVSFLEGDPNKPIVTGRVYNGSNLPPEVPNENTEKYILRDSAKNEIQMDSSDDDKGIYLSTKGTIDLSSSDIWSTSVGNSGSIGAGSSLSISGGASLDISGGISGSVSAGLNFSAGIGGNYTYTLGYTNAWTSNAWVNATNSDILNVAKEDVITGAGDQLCMVANCSDQEGDKSRSIYYADKDVISLSIGEAHELKKDPDNTRTSFNTWYEKYDSAPSALDWAVLASSVVAGGAAATAAALASAGSNANEGQKTGYVTGTGVAGAVAGVAYIAALAFAFKEWSDNNQDDAIEPIVHKDGEAEVKIALDKTADKTGVDIYSKTNPVVMSFGKVVEPGINGVSIHSEGKPVQISSEKEGEGSLIYLSDKLVSMRSKDEKARISINSKKADGMITLDNSKTQEIIQILSGDNILLEAKKGAGEVKIKSASFQANSNFKVLK